MYEEFYPSRCEVARWHDWKVLKTDGKMQREYCQFCKEAKWFNIEDNETYRNAHMRAFAQPFGYTEKMYREINGDQGVKEMDSLIQDRLDRKDKEIRLQEEFDKEMELDKKDSITISKS